MPLLLLAVVEPPGNDVGAAQQVFTGRRLLAGDTHLAQQVVDGAGGELEVAAVGETVVVDILHQLAPYQVVVSTFHRTLLHAEDGLAAVQTLVVARTDDVVVAVDQLVAEEEQQHPVPLPESVGVHPTDEAQLRVGVEQAVHLLDECLVGQLVVRTLFEEVVQLVEQGVARQVAQRLRLVATVLLERLDDVHRDTVGLLAPFAAANHQLASLQLIDVAHVADDAHGAATEVAGEVAQVDVVIVAVVDKDSKEYRLNGCQVHLFTDVTDVTRRVGEELFVQTGVFREFHNLFDGVQEVQPLGFRDYRFLFRGVLSFDAWSHLRNVFCFFSLNHDAKMRRIYAKSWQWMKENEIK